MSVLTDHGFRMPMTDELIKLIPSFDVISFDIFDTLLLRALPSPQDVWWVVEEKAGAKGFARDRIKADAKTFKNAIAHDGETTLDEIYSLIPKWRRLLEMELECEERFLVANPETVALWKAVGAAGKKRVIVSDMYLPGDFVRRILQSNGITDWDGFYLSSERGKRKSSGKLFAEMISDLKVSPDRVLHIGDNRRSDVEVPGKLGICAVEYVKPGDIFEAEFPFAALFRRSVPSMRMKRLLGSLAVGWHGYKYARNRVTYWDRIGYMFAGTLGYMYVRWIVDVSREKGISHLMFAGRDGYVWHKICQAIAPEMKVDYFYAPRTMSVRVHGAMGNDAVALRDREMFLESISDDIKPETELKSYRAYLESFGIVPERTALIDGCSSGFSAQRLVEAALGAPVFSFYLHAMAPLKNGAALYETDLKSLPFQNFSEFLFSSPEPPVERVGLDGPSFVERISPFEAFKSQCSDEIADGAVACAVNLQKFDISILPSMWIDYYCAFESRLTAFDRKNLAFAKNATDVGHKRQLPVLSSPVADKCIVSFRGHRIVSASYGWKAGGYKRTIYLFGRLPLARKTIFRYRTVY